jgi:hypothetical protein
MRHNHCETSKTQLEGSKVQGDLIHHLVALFLKKSKRKYIIYAPFAVDNTVYSMLPGDDRNTNLSMIM